MTIAFILAVVVLRLQCLVFVVLFQRRLSWKQVLNVVDTVSSVMLGTVVAFVIHASSMICSSHD